MTLPVTCNTHGCNLRGQEIGQVDSQDESVECPSCGTEHTPCHDGSFMG